MAEVLDGKESTQYQQVCDELVASFDDPSLTFSARILQAMKEGGIGGVGLDLAEHYRTMLQSEPLELLTEEQLVAEGEASWQRQREIELKDKLSFEEYLVLHGGQ